MANARPSEAKGGPAAKHAAPADALELLRKLRDKIVHVTVSDPADRQAKYAEFELPLSDSVVSALDTYLQPERSRSEPNARLAAALEEAEHVKPRFKSAQELFDALEKEGQG